ncbi:MAG: hypothetical protein IKB34_07035 [Clostridia bacterium]|nr:hypothetical protein [Clostridia bacterium]
MNKRISTVYKRELKALFCSPVGWLFIALNLITVGVCIAILNIKGGYISYEYSLEAASLAFCLTVPLLSTLSLSREGKRTETDILLRYTSSGELTVGKFLAWITVFSAPVSVSACLPPLLGMWGKIYYPAAYMGVAGYALSGLALLALGMYIASAIRRPWLCFAVTALSVILLNVAANLARITAEYNTVAFVICAVVLLALITVALFFYLENTLVAIIFAAVGSVTAVVLTLTDFLAPVMRETLEFISPQHAQYSLIYGTAALEGIVQPLMFCAVFLILTVLRFENRRRKEN